MSLLLFWLCVLPQSRHADSAALNTIENRREQGDDDGLPSLVVRPMKSVALILGRATRREEAAESQLSFTKDLQIRAHSAVSLEPADAEERGK